MPGEGGSSGGGLGLDFSVVIQAAVVGLVLFTAAVAAVRRAASRYFVVDAAGFAIAFDDHGGEPAYPMSPQGKQQQQQQPQRTMARGQAAADGEVPPCAECGGVGTKKCSGCKRMRYCSGECQLKHWQSDHKFNCKQMKLLDPVDKLSCGGDANSRKSPKSPSFGRISLVPGHRKSSKVIFPYDEFLKLYNWKDCDFLTCGLVNCGNSCFVNVVLQCLSCTRPLVAYLLGKDHTRECSTKHEDWCFLCELQSHIQRATDSLHPFAPMNILSHLPNIGGNLGFGRQEDAHEFMRFAIDKMQSACLDEFGGEKAVDLSTQETTIIQYIFGGRLQSQVQCTACGMVSNRYENMMDLTVEIHGDAGSLEECLNQFTAVEWLDGDNKYRCDGCSDYVKARKHLTVHQAPNILTITLKRFQSGRFGKLNKRVTFPTELDLAPYMSTTDGSDQYDLYAVIVHLDMLNASFFGHYICYIKDCQGCWRKIDDCKVMIVDEEEVHAQGAYMLLYNRRTARPRPLHAVKELVKQDKQCIVPPSNVQSHLTSEDVSLKCESLSKPSEDLCAGSGSSNQSLHKLDSMDQEQELGLHINIEADKFTANENLHLPISSASHVLEEATRGPGYLLEGCTTMRSEQFGNSACELSSASSSAEERKEPAQCIDSVDYMDIDSLAGVQVKRRLVQQEPVLGDSVGVMANETSLAIYENGISGKSPFSVGFLEETPRNISSLEEEGQNGSNIVTSSLKINGDHNEHFSRSEQGVIANNHGGLTSSVSVQCNGYGLATSSNGDYSLVNGDTQSSKDSLQAAKIGVPCVPNGFNPRPHREPSGSTPNWNSTSNGKQSVDNHIKHSWKLPVKECKRDKPFLQRGFLERPYPRVKSVKSDGGLPFSNGTLSSTVNGNSISSNISGGSSSISDEQEAVGAAVLPDQIQERWSSDCTTSGTACQHGAAVVDSTNGHHGENGHAVLGTKNASYGEESSSNGTLDMHGSSCQRDDTPVVHISENGMVSENADNHLKSRSAALDHDGLRRRSTSKYFQNSVDAQ